MSDREEELPPTETFVSKGAGEPPGKAGEVASDAYPGFEVKGEIGHGGMGTVYLARETSASRDVALKVLAGGRGSGEPRRRTRFLEEARVTAQLQHPGIVSVYRIGEGPHGRPYYAMRPIEGRTLRAVLDDLRRDEPATRDRFGLRRLVQVFQSVCQAVRFAHDRGVIHRDLKPSNVVVGDYGEVLVIDWGVAKAVSSMSDEAADGADGKDPPDADVWKLYERRVVSLREDDAATLQATIAGALMGTPAYMSPEQIVADVHDLDTRSDIWSLGVVLYELCTLKLPFEGQNVAELATQITKTVPPDPTTANPQRRVPPELRDVVLCCLKQDKSGRYDSVAELLTDIEHWLEGIAPWRLVKDVDFSEMPDGEPEGWTCVEGRWRVADGVLRSEVDHDNALLLDKKYSGDVRVEVEARVIEGAEGWIALCVPPQDVPGKWEEGYSLQFGAHDAPTAALQRKRIEVVRAMATHTPGEWHTVVAERLGDLVRLRVDGREILRWRDPEPLSGLGAGLYGFGNGLCVRRFRVFSRGLPLTVSCLAVPDALRGKGLTEDARVAYLQIVDNHSAREEGLQALFRAGKCNIALAADGGSDRTKQERLLDEARGFFDRMEGSPLGPMACLGKSLVHKFRGEVEKEADELARAYQDYPQHEGLAAVGERLLERALFFYRYSDPIRSALFGMPALRFHPASLNTGATIRCVERLPEVALVTERLTEFVRTSPSAYHRALAAQRLVVNWLWNGLWDRAEREIHERIAGSEGLGLLNALEELVELRERQQRYEEALDICRRIEHEWPDDRERLLPTLQRVLMLCGVWLGRCAEAEAAARRVFAEWPVSDAGLATVHLYFGWTLFLQGRLEEAEKEWRHVLRTWPKTAVAAAVEAWVGLCWLAVVRGADDEAIRHLEQACESWKGPMPLLVPLRARAIVHALGGRRDAVLRALEHSAEVYPDFAARAALHPDDAKAAAAWKLWSAQFRADGQLVAGLLAYARGQDAAALNLLTQSLGDPYAHLSPLLDWPVKRLLDRLRGQA